MKTHAVIYYHAEGYVKPLQVVTYLGTESECKQYVEDVKKIEGTFADRTLQIWPYIKARALTVAQEIKDGACTEQYYFNNKKGKQTPAVKEATAYNFNINEFTDLIKAFLKTL